MEITEIKTVPYTPQSHPFVERLIGTIRREFLDQLLFRNKRDLKQKLDRFKIYYNDDRAHSSINRKAPVKVEQNVCNNVIPIDRYRWKSHGQQLFQLPVSA